jgi:hypothetical protein
MNMTSSALDCEKSANETLVPSTLINEKSGADVPNGNIVLAVLTMAISPHREVSIVSHVIAHYPGALRIPGG